jgi:hypothetical protein
VFKIKVTASGGAEQTKDVSAKIIVCRSETISLVDSSLITYNMYRMDVPVAHLYTLASNWTSSDTDCPANTFSLTQDNTGTLVTSVDTYKVVDDETV